MKALTRGLTTLALVAATAACDGSPTTASALTAGDEGIAMARSGSTLTFSSTQSYDTQTEQTATGGVGGIDFTGSLTTGTPCVEVSAAHSQRQNNVTVTVSAAGTGGFCSQIITNNNYTGRVSGLAAGTYTFTVAHNTGGASSTAFSGTVTVQ
ncbi:MAG TPA: hypothetical protein VEQ60_13445 [Longimicrobium sp.]|nr:hypothetical protein [Longimicrobium sp.]